MNLNFLPDIWRVNYFNYSHNYISGSVVKHWVIGNGFFVGMR